ncbi:MAG TPA: EAL domain-containing protein [Acidimicrobiales bacterium]|nr:EAL domain-containing protein [Acidimicrobiales bacterium]
MGTGEEEVDRRDDFAAAVDRLLSPVAILAPDSTLLYMNPAAAHSLGQEPAWLLGRAMLDLVHPEDRPRVAAELQAVVAGRPPGGITRHRLRAGGHLPWRTFESTADNLLDNPAIAGIVVSSRDITAELDQERELRDAACRDDLTGLANRAAIGDHLARLVRQGARLSVAFVGLDRFKLVNDSLGHAAGDTFLKVAADRLGVTVPEAVMVGLFAGDVFVLLIPGASADAARELLWRVLERLAEPLFVATHELRLSASAGIAETDPLATAESVLRDASLALHHAKADGGGRVRVCQPEMREAAIERLEMEADLRRAIGGPDLALALQPIVELEDLRPYGAEALARWDRAGTMVPPPRFIEVAEETGLIVPLGDWIIASAAQIAPRAPGGRVSVNLSPRQLASPGLPERISRALRAHRLAPSLMAFEVTETLLMTEFDYAAGVLGRIRAMGCPVGLDDFGTGYSSLGYLHRLPLDFLKLDGKLTAGVADDDQAAAVVRSVIGMAEALGLDIVAEGVESEAQAARLRDLGCRFGQGYLYGRPEIPTGDRFDGS